MAGFKGAAGEKGTFFSPRFLFILFIFLLDPAAAWVEANVLDC